MKIYVQKVKTGEVWELSEDKSKEVYKENGETKYKHGIKSVHLYKFYPCDPREHCKEIERGSEGYQFNIMDYLRG